MFPIPTIKSNVYSTGTEKQKRMETKAREDKECKEEWSIYNSFADTVKHAHLSEPLGNGTGRLHTTITEDHVWKTRKYKLEMKIHNYKT